MKNGVCDRARFVASPNYDSRPEGVAPEAIIIHSISLPPGDYATDSVEQFFCNRLESKAHPYFAGISHLKVSAHFFIRRDGQIIQFVNANERAWHAGLSECLGRDCVNDFSIGIELEGWDEADDGFTKLQYECVLELALALSKEYSIPVNHCFRHSDIAPDRKNDPGPYFDWAFFCQEMLASVN